MNLEVGTPLVKYICEESIFGAIVGFDSDSQGQYYIVHWCDGSTSSHEEDFVTYYFQQAMES